MKMTELAWLFSFALNTKKSYQIRQKLQVSWFCFLAFLKNVWLFWSKIIRIVMFLFWFEEFYEWLKAKQKLFGEPDRKKWICTFRGEARVKSKWFSTSTDLKEEIVISKKNKSCNTSSNIYNSLLKPVLCRCGLSDEIILDWSRNVRSLFNCRAISVLFFSKY